MINNFWTCMSAVAAVSILAAPAHAVEAGTSEEFSEWTVACDRDPSTDAVTCYGFTRRIQRTNRGRTELFLYYVLSPDTGRTLTVAANGRVDFSHASIRIDQGERIAVHAFGGCATKKCMLPVLGDNALIPAFHTGEGLSVDFLYQGDETTGLLSLRGFVEAENALRDAAEAYDIPWDITTLEQ